MPQDDPSARHGLPHAEALAAFCANLSATDAPARVRRRAALHLLDTLGAALAGTCSTEFRAVRSLAAPDGPALLLGTGQRTGARDAALVNGVAAHVFELDDSGGCDHTGAVVLPALLAALGGMTVPVSGNDFLSAWLAGYEVGRRVLDAIWVMDMDEVLEARMASGLVMASSSANIFAFTSTLSTIASTTRSALAAS